MSYGKAVEVLQLCQMMAARHQGVTLQDIMDRFGVSRRTAERMRDAALVLMHDVTCWRDEEGRKHWRGHAPALPPLDVGAQDMALLHSAAEMFAQIGRQKDADRLRALADNLLAREEAVKRQRVEPDLELLLEAEGLASRPGLRVRISAEVVDALREAILMSRRARVHYRARGYRRSVPLLLEPHGFLYGLRPYLVARPAGREGFRHYRLQGVETVEITDEPFTRDGEFTITRHARRCFGTFLEEPFDVVWRFRPEAAPDAAEFVFHPDQKMHWLEDGSLEVRFRAGGALEMVWHLVTWGDAVEVIKPTDLFERAEKSRRNLAAATSREWANDRAAEQARAEVRRPTKA